MADDDILDEEKEQDQEEDLLAGAPIAGAGRSKIITILLWVAGSVVAVLLMVLISYLIAKKVKTDAYREEQNIVIAPAPPPLGTYHFQKEFRVNTADTDEAHFIQLTISFGYDTNNKLLELELGQRQAQMMHIINIILGGKKKEDLMTPMQKLNLAEEIKSQINMIFSQGKIEEVYFEELIIS
ncbi:MAG: flagellar basal body-associated FliL family protein [Spirochaetia bacterium]|nr:flagellar basal body-associated FliL family protein [Spirochaetia bacterium]